MVGARYPAFATSRGRVLIAGLSNEELDKYISAVELKPLTSKTIADRNLLRHEIMAGRDAGRRAVFGYFEGWGEKAKYPRDAARIRQQYFSSDDQLLTKVMGGEIHLPGYEEAWRTGRELDISIALHVVGGTPLSVSRRDPIVEVREDRWL